jgi:hypothetical protein
MSTLIDRIRIDNPQAIVEFLAAMEASENAPIKPWVRDERFVKSYETERLDNIVAKFLQYQGSTK